MRGSGKRKKATVNVIVYICRRMCIVKVYEMCI